MKRSEYIFELLKSLNAGNAGHHEDRLAVAIKQFEKFREQVLALEPNESLPLIKKEQERK